MRILRDSDDAHIDASVLTIGAFDGVHLGHQAIIATVCGRARALGIESAVVTFDVHPALVVRPESAPLILTPLDEKLELLEGLGVDVVYLIEFDHGRAATTAEAFMHEVFLDRLGVVEIVVGSDFHFGKGREGTVQFLAEHGAELGFRVDGLELVRHEAMATEHVSSTAIRRALADGDLVEATSMLGRRYSMVGTVVEGDKRGRTIGFPTANLIFEAGRARPGNGVYAAWATTSDGKRHMAAVNIGVRPTFHSESEAPVLEAHLLEFDADLYGSSLGVEFVAFLRSERKFDGIDALRDQLDVDIETVRSVLGADAA